MAKSKTTVAPAAPPANEALPPSRPEERRQELITQAAAPSLLTPAPLPEAAAAFLREVKGPVEQPARVPIVTISHGDGKFLLPSGELVDSISGYPIYYFHTRRFYKKPPAAGSGGKGLPPDCWSGDMLAPHQDSLDKQSELCATCSQNEFGTGRDGKSKACQTRTLVFLLNSAFGNPPLIVVDIPPSSLRPLIGNRFSGGYFSQAQARHGCYQIVWTSFALVPGGDLHHVILPTMGHCAPNEEAVQIAHLRNKFIAMMDSLRGAPPVTAQGEED